MRPYPPDILIFEVSGERTGVHSREPYSRGEEILLLRRHVSVGAVQSERHTPRDLNGEHI